MDFYCAEMFLVVSGLRERKALHLGQEERQMVSEREGERSPKKVTNMARRERFVRNSLGGWSRSLENRDVKGSILSCFLF